MVAMVSMCVLYGVCSKVEQGDEQQSCNTPAEPDSNTLVDEIIAGFAL
jgi:hypothetical protein